MLQLGIHRPHQGARRFSLAFLYITAWSLVNAGCPQKSHPSHLVSPQEPRSPEPSSVKSKPATAASLHARLLQRKSDIKVTLQVNGRPDDLRRWVLPRSLDTAPQASSAQSKILSCQAITSGQPDSEKSTRPATAKGPVDSAPNHLERHEARELLIETESNTALTLEYTIPLASLPPQQILASGKLLRGAELIAYPFNWKEQNFAFDVEVSIEGRDASQSVALSPGPWEKAKYTKGSRSLTSWAALVGPIQRARFEDQPGRKDSVAVLGRFLFDSRWLSAELSTIRSLVDAYFASPHRSEFTTLIYAATNSFLKTPISIESTEHGLLLALSQDANWDSPKRIALTQFLIRKKLVGLWDYSTAASKPWAKAAFEQGCARQIARSLLFEQGILSAQEYAEDLNHLQAASLDPHRPDQAKLALAIRSGAAMCRQLDRWLKQQKNESSSLKYWIHDLRIHRAKSKQALALSLGDSSNKLWHKVMLKGDPIQLEPQELAPCLRRTNTRYPFYDLGPVDPVQNQALGPLTPFAQQDVGLNPRDIFIDAQLDDAIRPTKVIIQVTRQGAQKQFEFTPPVIWKRGQGFERAPRIPDAECQL